ncbi:MAG: glycosyltransferase [Acidimicrobiia bacterium]|nr:glycosyltransferase [Acidimicrobiia bacterium]
MISIVIPAHDEEQVIGRCLGTLLAGAAAGEFDVVVVANGCRDHTAEVARSFAGVRVVETPAASKAAALNSAEAAGLGYPRVYLDADVEVDAPAIRAVAAALENDGVELAAPGIRFDVRGRSWGVRAWCRIWSRLPYATEDHVGSGLYALSRAGRQRFGPFPDTMAEDLFVWSCVPRSARKAVPDHEFTVHPPLRLAGLVRVLGRMHAASRADRALFADATSEVTEGQVRALARLLRSVRDVPAVLAYAGVAAAARLVARRPDVRSGRSWLRDNSARDAHRRAVSDPLAAGQRGLGPDPEPNRQRVGRP